MGRSRGDSGKRHTPAAKSKAAHDRGIAVNLQGNIGEVAFLHKAMVQGLVVAKPYGHFQRYDFIVEAGRNLWRVQVKAASRLRFGLYPLTVRCFEFGKRVTYSLEELDFLAAYVLPENAWFIVPAHEVVRREMLMLRPKDYVHGDRYALYREAWHLFREPDGVVIM